MVFNGNIVYIFAITFLVFGCGIGNKKQDLSNSSSGNYGWFIKYRNFPPDQLKQKFKNKRISCSYPSFLSIERSTDSILLFRPAFDDEKSFLLASVNPSTYWDGVIDCLKEEINEIPEKKIKDEIILNSKFYLIENINNRSILFGETSAQNHTIKTCLVNDSLNLFDFTLSYPSNLLTDSIDIYFSQFLNSFKWNGERVVPYFNFAEALEIELK